MPIAEAFYEAAIIPDLWKNALNLASEGWEADGVTVSSYPGGLSGLLCSRGMDEICARYVSEEWYKDDPRATRGVASIRRGNDIITDLDLFTAEELEASDYYSNFLGKSGFRWFAGSVLAETGGVTVTLSIDRRIGRDPFMKDQLARIRSDLPHVRRAARLAVKSRLTYADGLVDGIEQFDCGAVLLDRLGRVIRMNKKAEAFLGEDLQVVSSKLRSPHREANTSLQKLVTANIQPVFEGGNASRTSALLHRLNDIPLIVGAYPVVRQATDVFQGARAILLIRDLSEHRPVSLGILQDVFGLTSAEVRVAAALLKGLDTQQIASELQVKPETIRYHLKSMFSKTGAGHQAQLVSLFARFPKSSK